MDTIYSRHYKEYKSFIVKYCRYQWQIQKLIVQYRKTQLISKRNV